jgi:Na+-translocating ferredoxin:NAD+ oxidoreductase RnfC subunit
VQAGQTVAAGSPLTEVPEQALGVPVHAPFAGTAREVSAEATVLERGL